MRRDGESVSEALEQVQCGDMPCSSLQLTNVWLGDAYEDTDVCLTGARPFPEVADDSTHVPTDECVNDFGTVPEARRRYWRSVLDGH